MSAHKQSVWGSEGRLYVIWAGIKTRCCNPHHSNYKNYGARGITMCEEWKSYPAFESWAMKSGYDPNAEKKSLSIERIDNEQGYFPENCVWATPKDQMNNTRRSIKVESNGETYTLSQLADHLNMNYSTFMSRYSRGWSIERIVNTPVQKKGVHKCQS